MDSRPDSSNLQELERELESGRQRIKLYKLENEKLQASIRGLKSKVTNQSSLIRGAFQLSHREAIQSDFSCEYCFCSTF
jgi:chromosome segregation ATPase